MERRIGLADQAIFPVKPQSFLPEIIGVDQDVNPPLSEQQCSALMEQYGLSLQSFTRLGLFVYGLDVDEHLITGREDGVIAGVDTFISTSCEEVKQVELGVPGIDLDAGRLAAFVSRSQDTPYSWDGNQILFWGQPTGLFVTPFPKDGMSGKFYLRTDRAGSHSRLVINPRPACETNCAWCARTYKYRVQLLGERLERRLQEPESLLAEVASHPNVIAAGGLEALTEINFISGDFLPKELYTQTQYLIEFITLAREQGFAGSYYYAGHQVFESGGLAEVRQKIGVGKLCYTVEHLTRRPELMPLKGKVALSEVSEYLAQTAQLMGVENTEYYLIAGLDPADTVKKWLSQLKDTAVPQVHVFTPYAPTHYRMMLGSRVDQMKTILEIRSFILKEFGQGIPSGSNRSLFHLADQV